MQKRCDQQWLLTVYPLRNEFNHRDVIGSVSEAKSQQVKLEIFAITVNFIQSQISKGVT